MNFTIVDLKTFVKFSELKQALGFFERSILLRSPLYEQREGKKESGSVRKEMLNQKKLF